MRVVGPRAPDKASGEAEGTGREKPEGLRVGVADKDERGARVGWAGTGGTAVAREPERESKGSETIVEEIGVTVEEDIVYTTEEEKGLGMSETEVETIALEEAAVETTRTEAEVEGREG